MEKYIPCKWEVKESWSNNLISDKIDLKIKIVRDKEGHYIMIKGWIQEEDITIINIYAPNIGSPQYIRQTLTYRKGETDSNTVTVGDFNTHSHQWTDCQNKINKETQVWNDTLDEMDLIDIFSTFHPNAEEYTFFSSAHGIFSRIDHILGHKSNLSKLKKIEIVSSIFFWPQCYETRYQQQEKKCEKHKHMEIKQHVSK